MKALTVRHTKDYTEFISKKSAKYLLPTNGLNVQSADLHPRLYAFQRLIVERALQWGRVALFEDCGLGKTIQELEWAKYVEQHTGSPVLIFAPLAVGQQMVAEGKMIGLDVKLVRSIDNLKEGIGVTNYHMLHQFTPERLGGVVLDESGILKGEFGKTRAALTDFVSSIPYRMAATATPAPNDLPELLNHAEYLGVMTRKEALALYFTQDGNSTHNWRLKKHAVSDFWKWVGSWAIVARTPDDIGCPMFGYDLPALHQIIHTVNYESSLENGKLISTGVGLAEMRRIRKDSLAERVQKCADLVNHHDESWVVWCELNDESAMLSRLIPDAVEIKGGDSIESKTDKLIAFGTGEARVVVTKPSIAGHGLNWQHCARVAFVGSSYSYEQQYQAIRRCWRYGQLREVEVHHIGTEEDIHVMEVVQTKQAQQDSLYDNIPWQVGQSTFVQGRTLETDCAQGDGWTLHLGDSVDTIDQVESESVGMSVFSPPFPGMYVYTNSAHDMGNVSSISEMIEQFAYLMGADKMMRVLMPGRSIFIHVTQGIAQLGRDSYVGLKDFRGDVIRMMEGHGWHYYGEVVIDKNPQVKAVRTMDGGLQFKTLRTDSSRMHCAMSDMLLQFRKPGENPAPIKAGGEQYGNTSGWVTNEDWILWARPVWYADDFKPFGSERIVGISETNVLNVSEARTASDERHLCPLQLDVIERCVKVWSAPGEVVYSPFAGVGSEGVVALRQGRRFVGGELKRSYWEKAKLNLQEAGSQMRLI